VEAAAEEGEEVVRGRIATALVISGLAIFLARCSSSSSNDVADAGHEGGPATDGSQSGDDGSTDDGSSGGGGCQPACIAGRHCCGTKCANTGNDPTNCGGCGTTCPVDKPYCDGSCKLTPCDPAAPTCTTGQQCCGTACCAKGDICCRADDKLGAGPKCHTPTKDEPTCPAGCAPICK
jgi:hypothetical protein